MKFLAKKGQKICYSHWQSLPLIPISKTAHRWEKCGHKITSCLYWKNVCCDLEKDRRLLGGGILQLVVLICAVILPPISTTPQPSHDHDPKKSYKQGVFIKVFSSKKNRIHLQTKPLENNSGFRQGRWDKGRGQLIKRRGEEGLDKEDLGGGAWGYTTFQNDRT